jgi:hypothetical protein
LIPEREFVAGSSITGREVAFRHNCARYRTPFTVV